MTIYVDDWFQQARAGRHTSRWCHLFSDTSDDELHAFAARIGLRRSYFQKGRSPLQVHRHYDVTEGMRRAAVAAGAVEITWREAGRMATAERDRLHQAKTAPAPQEPT